MKRLYVINCRESLRNVMLDRLISKTGLAWGLTLALWGGYGCAPESYSQFMTPQEPALSATVWDLIPETKASLQSKGWLFDDCWQFRDGGGGPLSHSRFPTDFMAAGATCGLSLPAYSDANAIRLQMEITHTLGKLPTGGDSYVGFALQRPPGGDLGAAEPLLLRQLPSSAPGGDTTTLSAPIAPAESVRLKLLLHAGRDVKIEAGTWGISKIVLQPRTN